MDNSNIQAKRQWGIRYTIGVNTRVRYRSRETDQLLTQAEAEEWAEERNRDHGEGNAVVISRLVTDWTEANPKPEEE